MKVLVCPVSGGSFVHQIASNQHLANMGYRPDVCLCSSGGNVAVHVAEGARWDPYMMSRLASRIDSSFLLKTHSTNTMFRYMGVMLKGTLYDSGDGAKDFFCSYIDCIKEKTEIWVGVYNKTLEKPENLCNKVPTNFRVRDEPSEECKDFYMYCQASASIPLIVPAVNINGYEYQDGGVSSASPLNQFADQLISKKCPVQITYITPIDPHHTQEKAGSSMLHSLMGTIDDMIRASIKNDETTAITIIKARLGKVKKREGKGVPRDLIEELHSSGKDYLLVLYPFIEKVVDITDMKGSDIPEVISQCYTLVRYKVYY
jgi:hypothetical protein